jgi:serine-type D-Ala-D-Ala carboxypeptidase (penicillin-binding protein 5/6)
MIIRRYFFLILCALVTGLSIPASAQLFGGRRSSESSYDAAAWLITDTTTGFVLDGANTKQKRQIGSITKIATAVVMLDWASANGEDIGQFATVPESVTPLSSPNSIGLLPGAQISLRDALYAAMMQSDNQAAETLAVFLGRKVGNAANDRDASDFFVSQMNSLARKLNMRDTRFLNAHGLDDLEEKLPYSTAADVARLANYALSRPGFTFYASQKERRISWTAPTGEVANYLLKNTNELLGMDGIDGVKTGTTRRAGACVVISSAQRPESKQNGDQINITPRRLTVVVLGSETRFDTTKAILASGWGLLDQWAAAGRPMKGWKPKGGSR